MTTRHAVYRFLPDLPGRWRSYVVGAETVLSIEAPSLPQARFELEQRLLTELFPWPEGGVVEHLEHPLGDDLWLREAQDPRVIDRARASRVILEVFDDQRLRDQLATLPSTRAGGISVLAGVPGDALDWIRDQHDGHGSLVVANPVTNHRLWWNALTPDTDTTALGLPWVGSLAELDLIEPQTTLEEWTLATDPGRLVTLPANLSGTSNTPSPWADH